MYLYNKDILKYAEIVVVTDDGNSRILNIEGHSSLHISIMLQTIHETLLLQIQTQS